MPPVNGTDEREFLPEGKPYLRVQNVRPFDVVIESIVYVNDDSGKITLQPDDILLTRKGTFGVAAIVQNNITSYSISSEIILLRTNKSLPFNEDFLVAWLNTSLIQLYFDRRKTGAIMGHITQDVVSSIPVPKIPLKTQEKLIATLDAAREHRRAKIAEADALLAGLDDYLLATLKLTPPPKDDRKAFAVRLVDIKGKQIGPNHYAPALQNYLKVLASSPYPTRPLHENVAVNPQVPFAQLADDTPVSFVPMEAVEDKAAGGVTLTDKTLGEVKKGYTPFADGDVIWAKITPCMENGKSAIVRKLTNGIGFGSTEFHVLRPLNETVTAEYVHEFISQAALRKVATCAFTGSAGHRRVPAEFLQNLPMPVPPLTVQAAIAAESRRRRETARTLRAEADTLWHSAKQEFERQLLGSDLKPIPAT